MEGINKRCLAKIKQTGRKTIIPISLVYKKSENGKFQQATNENAKSNVDMYMKVPGKGFVPISILRFRTRKSQLLKIINLSPPAKRIHIAKTFSITPRPARKSGKPVNKGIQRNTREARVTKKKSQYNKENALRCSDDNVMTCGLRVDDIILPSTSSQQLQQIPDEIEYENGLHSINDNITCCRTVENANELIEHNSIGEVLTDVDDTILSSTSSQQLQQITDQIEYCFLKSTLITIFAAYLSQIPFLPF
ncbi:hypothetical protein PV327_011204 [Microctonus hyperodae]|uniref:Uncharacterized protein n=1 Tax=Microctonus hyperodae TaxID=165561 RepID=A0AA39C519_MICHY|nr:hypothetical protein PV327_011204 [Microctonus hyperodae]